MIEFLRFDRFISPAILICCYYLGAIFMPLALWLLRKRLLRFLSERFRTFASLRQSLQQGWQSLSLRQKILTVLAFVLLFLMMEIAWRMLFEAMIGYFDMHDYLYRMSRQAAS